jgi:hypothetical protein
VDGHLVHIYDLSYQLNSNPCPQNDPTQGDLMAALAAADPQVDFCNLDHLVLVLVAPYRGCCLRGPGDIGVCGEVYKQQIAAHAYPNSFIKG